MSKPGDWKRMQYCARARRLTAANGFSESPGYLPSTKRASNVARSDRTVLGTMPQERRNDAAEAQFHTHSRNQRAELPRPKGVGAGASCRIWSTNAQIRGQL